jgi:alkylhydroperoxidase/carboxymuconolactone decarboxylase family protein YurZ
LKSPTLRACPPDSEPPCRAERLRGHIQGNVNVGNDKANLLSAVTQLLPYVGYPRTLNAISCLNEVLPEPSQSERDGGGGATARSG